VLELFIPKSNNDLEDKSILVMSTSAYHGFTDEQKKIILENVSDIVHSDISLIGKILLI
jgi:hypothetical protein